MRNHPQVRDLKEKPGSDVAKLSNNEAKLTAARQRLQEATSKLYKGFGYYDAVGGTLCQPEVEMLKKAQQGFFGSAYTVVRGFRLCFGRVGQPCAPVLVSRPS